MTNQPQPEEQEPELTKRQILRNRVAEIGRAKDLESPSCWCGNPEELHLRIPTYEEMLEYL